MAEVIEKWINGLAVSKIEKDHLKNMTTREKDLFFNQPIEFGTGGMRGRMHLGISGFNKYTLRKAIITYAKYLNSTNVKHKIAIGYDPRNNSKKFANDIAAVLSTFEIDVLLFDHVTTTPMLSFAINQLRCTGGVMITASHNPKEDNGCKLYDETGCQLLPNVIKKILKFDKGDDYLNTKFIIQGKRIKKIDKSIVDKYVGKLKPIEKLRSGDGNIKVAFSSLNGSSFGAMKKIFKSYKIDALYEVNECKPDGNFTYTVNANPENRESFTNVNKIARKNKSDISLVTDPDADRVGVSVWHDNDYVALSGNEVGVLLTDYLLEKYKEGYIATTIVSSELPVKMANAKGLKAKITLTGFKYIGDQIKRNEKEFVFGFEESYGYLHIPMVRDKDALQICLLVCRMADFYKKKKMSLVDRLDEIYDEYGYYKEAQVNFNFGSKHELKEKIYDYFATDNELKKELKITEVIKTNPKELLKFKTKNGSICVRKSGTEPKIKFYLAINGDHKNKKVIDKELSEQAKLIQVVIKKIK